VTKLRKTGGLAERIGTVLEVGDLAERDGWLS
jgi:hypothetical protein